MRYFQIYYLLFGGSILSLLWVGCEKPSDKDMGRLKSDYPITPISFDQVDIHDGFWRPRIDTNRNVTIPFDFQKAEETGRIHNFAVAGGVVEGEFEGLRYNDSDVYKIIEGASYALSLVPDPALSTYLDSVIALIAAAQEADGYLFTTRTINPDNPKDADSVRWGNLAHDHELYNAGHLYEAAVAHYQATDKRDLLDVAIKNADLIDQVFGPGKKIGVPGHQEIEIGLIKLYRVTGEKRYLNLARFFLDNRGEGSAYSQDHLPVTAQTEAVGHAVRAGYMYAAMADIAALQQDSAYEKAMDEIWKDVVSSKLYLTGGVGASRKGEAFGESYELPNATAYNETCAAIASMLWNYRLFLLHGEAKYYDVLERTLYNGFLSGVSLEGDAFFYPNPLESDGKTPFNQGLATRSPWFNTACCPVNVVRFLPSLAGYIYAMQKDQLYVNLYINSSITIATDSQQVSLRLATSYPWEGDIKMTFLSQKPQQFSINLRIPGWATNQPVPGDLYTYRHRDNRSLALQVNGELVFPEIKNGYARIERIWKPGDEIRLVLPMSVRQVIAHKKVLANQGKVALERGPIVYCMEAIDNGGTLEKIQLVTDEPFSSEYISTKLGGIVQLQGKALKNDRTVEFTAIPYYAWSHRGAGEMKVWLPYK